MSQFQEITDKFSTSLETIASAVNTSKLEVGLLVGLKLD